MAKIESSEVIQNLIAKLRLDAAGGTIPNETGNLIIPVFIANPIPQILVDSNAISDATTGTLFTTHPTKRTFITALSLTVSKDVLSQSILTTISSTLANGIGIALLSIRYEPLTVGQFTESISFPIPVELAKGVIVRGTNSNATASIDITPVIYFYELEE